MKRNNRKLYESIMKDVSKVIKKRLNENANELLDDLLIYINVNRNFSNNDIKLALKYMEEERCPLYMADDIISSDLNELCLNFANDNNLSPNALKIYTDDIDDLFYKFVDKFESEIWNNDEDDFYDSEKTEFDLEDEDY